ncbi:alpha-ketoacid dehydrogenase subunit alpha/beta [Nocardioides pantholopis]|uniref:alpha-ketoacid dehydrogenase subunit alpha/beta n=1 Tax=Nocardioides pantholopis TaxID=2483798 RepID=UPI000F09A4AA|nr:alpha-ketoacid dehydrogenase subunit alpha/beta [Nocardioides pantholopis]
MVSLAAEDLVEMYRRMVRIRRFEEQTSALYRDTEVPGFVHLSIGQEASAVGACWPLRRTDGITSTHRGHGHCIAKGLDVQGMFAELMGKSTGTCGGRGGSMHIADPGLGIYGANGIVGAGLPIATGAAQAARLDGDGVVVAFFGDGAVAQGMFHEALNLAGVWNLPVLFLCENNHYSEFSPEASQHRAPLAARAAGYGMEHHLVDGNDVVAVAEATSRLIEAMRAGSGPCILEADTYRWHGHYEGDPQRYRTPEELTTWQGRDPLVVARRRLAEAGVEEATVRGVEDEVETEIEAAVAQARLDPEPEPLSLTDFVYAERAAVAEPAEVSADAPVFKTMAAVRQAIEHEMLADPSVYVAGVDVAAGGNVFGLFRGLAEAFPGRVLDTPISESAVLGSAVGAAMAGKKPVVELMYMDFIGVCFDALLNQAAKLRFMTGGRAPMSLVVRTQFGAGRSSGSQHSQSLEALLAHVPGLTVVMPSNPTEAYGLLRSAIQDPNPVVFVENRLQYGMKGPQPPEDYRVPLGKARVRRPGTDVTVVSYSRLAVEAEAAADELAAEGISAEVIDLRTVMPLDRETILESVRHTHRLVIVHEGVMDFGVGAEIAAMAANEGFWYLDAPVVRVAPPAMPAPYAPALEKLWLPDRAVIADAIRRAVQV